VRVLLFGPNGQVGRALRRAMPADAEVIVLDRNLVDLAKPEAIGSAVEAHRPAVIVNAAAYTAVDRAESEPDAARQINAAAPLAMARAAAAQDALLLHYSTDYVFDGRKAGAYVESDPTNPLSVYGRTKLEGEQAIQASGCRHVVLRTSWVYGNDGANFMKTMLRLAGERDHLRVVDDQIGAPTSSDAIAEATWGLLHHYTQCDDRASLSGIYHFTCGGSTSWHGFATAIFEVFLTAEQKSRLTVEPIPATAYPTPAQRPSNSLLSNDKLQAAFHLALPDWRTALQDVRTRAAR
jgi:dTDP-4-dehydrorhamnose reductase